MHISRNRIIARGPGKQLLPGIMSARGEGGVRIPGSNNRPLTPSTRSVGCGGGGGGVGIFVRIRTGPAAERARVSTKREKYNTITMVLIILSLRVIKRRDKIIIMVKIRKKTERPVVGAPGFSF